MDRTAGGRSGRTRGPARQAAARGRRQRSRPYRGALGAGDGSADRRARAAGGRDLVHGRAGCFVRAAAPLVRPDGLLPWLPGRGARPAGMAAYGRISRQHPGVPRDRAAGRALSRPARPRAQFRRRDAEPPGLAVRPGGGGCRRGAAPWRQPLIPGHAVLRHHAQASSPARRSERPSLRRFVFGEQVRPDV